jgi:hypothetical protein
MWVVLSLEKPATCVCVEASKALKNTAKSQLDRGQIQSKKRQLDWYTDLLPQTKTSEENCCQSNS